MLRIEHLSKTYGDKKAVDDLNLHIAKKNKARSKVSTVLHFLLFALLIFGLLGGIFTFLAVMLCPPLLAAGMDFGYILR